MVKAYHIWILNTFKHMEKKIFFHDTDSGGVVYYARYLNYLEESRTEFLEQKGLSVQEFHEQGFLYAVRTCNLSYRSPARYGDIVSCSAKLKKITAAQLFFDQKIINKKSGRLLLEAEVSLVCLTLDFKPTQIPEIFRNKLLEEK